MHSFLLQLSNDHPTFHELQAAASVTTEILERRGFRSRAACLELGKQAAGFLLHTDTPGDSDLVTVHRGERVSVVVFGSVDGVPPSATARVLATAFERHGIDCVRDLDGSFGAAIIERGSGATSLVSDLVGQRALRYAEVDGQLFVSPHDLCLVATGSIDLEFDETSFASSAAIEWSVRGQSFLRAVRAAQPYEIVRWSATGLTVERCPRLDLDTRVAARDRHATRQLLDEMTGTVQQRIRHAFAAAHGEIEIALTAGIDSRSLLGPAIAELGASRLRGHTYGDDGSLDARVGRRLARATGIQFGTSIPTAPNVDQFSRNLDLLALLTNGDACADRLVFNTDLSVTQSPSIGGQGGEIFRGFFQTQATKSSQGGDAVEALAPWLKRLDGMPFRDSGVPAAVRRRLHRTFDPYAEMSERVVDQLDLFYLFERFGRWASVRSRLPWLSHQLQPFHQSNLVRLGYRLPESQRHDELLHRALIDRHLPFGCRWTEINGQRLLPLAKLRSPRLSRVPSTVRRRTAKLTRPLTTRRATQPPLSLERAVVERTTSLLEAGPLRKLITGEGSVGRRLFPLEELHRMTDGLAAGHSALRLVLGSLLTAESYSQTMRETASLARRSIAAGGATHTRSLVKRAS